MYSIRQLLSILLCICKFAPGEGGEANHENFTACMPPCVEILTSATFPRKGVASGVI